MCNSVAASGTPCVVRNCRSMNVSHAGSPVRRFGGGALAKRGLTVQAIPLLIAQSIAFGIIASYAIGVHLFQQPGAYWNFNVERFTDGTDIAIAMTKGFVFGLLIVVISCHQGLRARNGAVGVGRGTTDAMVFSSLAILISNLFITLLMQLIFPTALGMS